MSGPTNPQAAPEQDERAIRALVDRMFDSWGRGDAVAYHADLTDDADYVSFDGSRRGTADRIRSHENLFRTVLYGSRLTGQVESVRFITPDVAVVHLTGSVWEGWRQRMRRRRLSRQTMVVVRRDGRWQVTAFHNTGCGPCRLAARWSSWAAGSSAGAPTGPGASSAEREGTCRGR
ncbi:MAG TPA: SgcJ/EcaC family oxidoreductase [Propionibacteriaceae bacterium]|nr:SgcJ/EcaC family oxidoreductase [Propionibacteriaceae bacterium]